MIGAKIGTMTLKNPDTLFNHPQIDKGLEQFLKDHIKAFQNG